MSVWKCKDRDGYKWEFQKDGKPYFGYTDTKQEGIDAEAEQRQKLKDAKKAAEAATTSDAPSFICPTIMEWAGIFLTDEEKRINGKANWTDRKKKARIAERENMLTVLLRFFGARPEKEKPIRHTAKLKDLRPYHHLRLDDPIRHAKWLQEFDAHQEARGLDGNTKNNQQSNMSVLYKHALKKKNRVRSGITVNPFRDLEREEARRRTRTVTIDEFMRIYTNAAKHLQKLAIDIGTYAYALRIGSILQLTIDDMDEKMMHFTVWDHKTRKNGAPMVVPIVKVLRDSIKRALADPDRNPESRYLVQFPARTGRKKGKADGIAKIHSAVQGACERADVQYGRAGDGVTFHTIRHWMNTEAARKGIAKAKRKEMSGHSTDKAIDWYDHFDAEIQRPALQKFTGQIAAERAAWTKKQKGSPSKSPSKVLPIAGFVKEGRTSRQA